MSEHDIGGPTVEDRRERDPTHRDHRAAHVSSAAAARAARERGARLRARRPRPAAAPTASTAGVALPRASTSPSPTRTARSPSVLRARRTSTSWCTPPSAREPTPDLDGDHELETIGSLHLLHACAGAGVPRLVVGVEHDALRAAPRQSELPLRGASAARSSATRTACRTASRSERCWPTGRARHPGRAGHRAAAVLDRRADLPRRASRATSRGRSCRRCSATTRCSSSCTRRTASTPSSGRRSRASPGRLQRGRRPACCRSRRCCGTAGKRPLPVPTPHPLPAARYPVAGADGRPSGGLLRLPPLPVGRRRRARLGGLRRARSTRRARPGSSFSRRAACGATGERAERRDPKSDGDERTSCAVARRSTSLRRELRARLASAARDAGRERRVRGGRFDWVALDDDLRRRLGQFGMRERSRRGGRVRPRSRDDPRARGRCPRLAAASAGGASRWSGLEHVPDDRPVLFVANHSGLLPCDGLVLARRDRARARRGAPPALPVADWLITLPFVQPCAGAPRRRARVPRERGAPARDRPLRGRVSGGREGRRQGLPRPLPAPALRPRRRGARRARGRRARSCRSPSSAPRRRIPILFKLDAPARALGLPFLPGDADLPLARPARRRCRCRRSG